MNAFSCPIIVNDRGCDPIKLSTSGRRYRKDAIRVGNFTARNPVDGSDVELNVTPERMLGWLNQFQAMKHDDRRIDLTVDHKRGAEAVRGQVTNMEIDGDTLYFECEAADDDAAALLGRCPQVSVEIEPPTTMYGEAITAISVCRKPVVGGQGAFERIAASHDDDRGDFALHFSRQRQAFEPDDWVAEVVKAANGEDASAVHASSEATNAPNDGPDAWVADIVRRTNKEIVAN